MNRPAQNLSGKNQWLRAVALGGCSGARWRSAVAAVGLAATSGLVACSDEEAQQSAGELQPPQNPEDTSRPLDSSFQKVTLNGAPGEPIGLVVLPDGRVLHTTRGGRVLLHDPATGFNRVVA